MESMKENMLDVLVFLFDNYLGPEGIMDQQDQSLVDELEEAGFDFNEISKAFSWLGSLKESEITWQASPTSLRVFTQAEQQRLDVEARGFLMQLGAVGMIHEGLREKILEAVMDLDLDQVTLTLKTFKRIVGLVLMNASEVIFDLDPKDMSVH